MRIISQGSHVDLLYERTSLCLDVNHVIARCDGKEYLMGVYSSETKAIQAVEMCREKYGQCKANEILLTGSRSRFDCHAVDFENVAKANIFQFTKDDETKI